MVSCHYYAVHPHELLRRWPRPARTSADWPGGPGRNREPDCLHVYFTGCAGNIAAGKYNDGSHAMRPILVQRMLDGIVALGEVLKPQPIGDIAWKTTEFLPAPDPRWDIDQIRKQIADPKQAVVGRNRPSYTVAWLERCRAADTPILLSSLPRGT